jgi:SAM-dependent methyltransferase
VPKVWFDERIAAGYDATSTDMSDPAVVEPAVDLLAELAGGGAALELGVGTGRIALPLSRRGVPVCGLDLSAPMLEQLRAKPGGDRIDLTVGDCASTKVGATFRVVYLVYNTINNLTTQDEQVACFSNAADHLEPGGCFLIECVVPDLRRVPPGETGRVFHQDRVHLGVDEYEPGGDQVLWSHHYWKVGDRVEAFSMPFRYAWPSELDLMARLAGMRLRDRWSDWHRAPFTFESTSHVSVWEKPA